MIYDQLRIGVLRTIICVCTFDILSSICLSDSLVNRKLFGCKIVSCLESFKSEQSWFFPNNGQEMFLCHKNYPV